MQQNIPQHMYNNICTTIYIQQYLYNNIYAYIHIYHQQVCKTSASDGQEGPGAGTRGAGEPRGAAATRDVDAALRVEEDEAALLHPEKGKNNMMQSQNNTS